jgi:hypothetical protein
MVNHSGYGSNGHWMRRGEKGKTAEIGTSKTICFIYTVRY